MNVTRLGANAFLVELPAQLADSDGIPITEALTANLHGKNGFLLLDFGAVQFMNGLGAYSLVKLNVLTGEFGFRLLAYNVSQHYKDVLKVTGLAWVIKIYDSRKDAYKEAGVTNISQMAKAVLQNPSDDESFWAKPVLRLSEPEMPPEAINRNMKGRRVVGPIEGFGQLWQKTYRLTIEKQGLTAKEVITTLKQKLPAFQPPFNHFYPTKAGIIPGEVVAIDSSTPGGPVSTGVLVLYADDVSFTFMTPQGHPESGWVTFSAYEKDGKITAQIIGLARANDPVFEAAFRTVGSKMQVKIWKHVLVSLAEYLGVPPDVMVEPRCIDKNLQWSQLGNIWYNAQIRTIFYMPFRGLGKMLNRSKGKGK